MRLSEGTHDLAVDIENEQTPKSAQKQIEGRRNVQGRECVGSREQRQAWP